LKRKLIILGIVVVTMLVILVVVSLLPTESTVFFSTAQAETNGTTPPMLKVAFYVTNTAGRAVFLLAAIERNRNSVWLADTQSFPAGSWRPFGKVEPNDTARLSFEFPHEVVQTRLRVLVAPEATTLQKTQSALRRLWKKSRSQGNYKQLWLDDLFVPTYEIVTPEIP